MADPVKPVNANRVANVKKPHWEADCPECGRRQTHDKIDAPVRCMCGCSFPIAEGVTTDEVQAAE